MATKTKKSTKKFSLARLIPSSKKFQMLAVAGIFGIVGASFVAFSSAQTATVPVYRLNSPHLPNYFYTTVRAEYDGLPTYGYAKEGTGFNAWATGGEGRVPVYQVGVNNIHVFTSDVSERDNLVRGGWTTDRVAFYAYNTPGAGRKAVHRLYHPQGTHLMTISDPEKDSAIASHGYAYEGIAFYVSNEKPVGNDHKPEGVVDKNDCSIVAGWTLDQDNASGSTEVHIYVDGTGYNLGRTSGSRPDVNSAKGASGNHGFTWALPAQYHDGKVHTVDVYAININSAGQLSGDNTRIAAKALACKSGAKEVEVGTCVTKTFATSNCTKDQSQSNGQLYVGPNEIASCVAIDGATMIRCSQAEHDKQVAAGVLIEKGCLGKTLDGSNRVDCSASSKATLDHFFQGLAAQKAAEDARAKEAQQVQLAAYLASLAPRSSGGGGGGTLPPPPPPVGAGNGHSTGTIKASCVIWYRQGSPATYREAHKLNQRHVMMDSLNGCRASFGSAKSTVMDNKSLGWVKSHFNWNGANFNH